MRRRSRARSPRAVSEAPLRGITDFIGVCGRFRYSDLKEALAMGFEWCRGEMRRVARRYRSVKDWVD